MPSARAICKLRLNSAVLLGRVLAKRREVEKSQGQPKRHGHLADVHRRLKP